MITWRWITSHRCSWMAVYVYCCNAKSNLIGVKMSSICIVILSQSVNCPVVICSPNMLFILRRTHLVNYGPWSISLSLIYHLLFTITVYFLQANHYLPHYTFNPLFSSNRWDWQPHRKLGQSIVVVLCRFQVVSNTLEVVSLLLLVR